MRIIVGIDVSKNSSHVAIQLNDVLQAQFRISNDQPGFSQLESEIRQFLGTVEVVFEATGVYSHRLRRYLSDHGLPFVELNPLSAKKEMDRLRKTKNDTRDAVELAMSQYLLSRPMSHNQPDIYAELMRESRYYQQCVSNLVSLKNRLHKALQDTFPEVEQLFSKTEGPQYWQIVATFPHAKMVERKNFQELTQTIQNGGPTRISESRAKRISEKLFKLAARSYPAVRIDSHMVYEVQSICRQLVEVSDEQNSVTALMIEQAKPLAEFAIYMSIPGFAEKTTVGLLGELGNIRRFDTPNQINAYIGIDLRFNDSGDYKSSGVITKRGNPYARKILFKAIGNMASAAAHGNQSHINDWYQKKKQSNPSKGTKKIAIGAMDRLISTIFHLVLTNQKYDYDIACLARH